MDDNTELMPLTREDSVGMLREIVDMQRRSLRHARIATVVSLLMAGAMLFILVTTVPRMNRAIDSAEQSIEQVNTFVTSADRFVNENTGSIAHALERLDEIDLQKLNEAIGNLSDAVEPLARLYNFFNNR